MIKARGRELVGTMMMQGERAVGLGSVRREMEPKQSVGETLERGSD